MEYCVQGVQYCMRSTKSVERVDTCQACGEEHEPPSGAKCKLVKTKKQSLKGVKMEAAEVTAEEV